MISFVNSKLGATEIQEIITIKNKKPHKINTQNKLTNKRKVHDTVVKIGEDCERGGVAGEECISDLEK